MIADPRTYASGVPHQEFRRRQTEGPISWIEEPQLHRHDRGSDDLRGGRGFWAVTRHAAVMQAARAPKIYSSAAQGAFLADPRTVEDLHRTRQLLINMDSPEHARVRRHVSAAFSSRAVQALTERVRAHAAVVVDRVSRAERFDAVADLAAELPLLVLTELLGMPSSDRGLLFDWSNNLVGFDDPEYGGGDVDRYRQTFADAFGYARELARDRRRRPAEDLVSRLVVSEIDGQRLSDAEFCQLWLLLVIAGNETTRHLLSGSLLALAENPAQRDRLVAEPELTSTAVDELLRWVTPIMHFRRTATEDGTLCEQSIRAGDKVVLWYVAANRDPAVFAEPDRLDLGRRPNPHLAFGVGPHYCLGSHLAHLETRVVLDLLRPHLHRLRVVGPPARLESNFMNGIKVLPMSLAG